MHIDYQASREVREFIASLGRTEDVRFSPNNRRLAIAAFNNSAIALLDIQIAASLEGNTVSLSNPSTISSAQLNYPHGVDFIDDDTIVVANREASASILALPGGRLGSNSKTADVICPDGFDLLASPGSVAVTRKAPHLYEALICNNYINTVTRHSIDLSVGCTVTSSEVLLRKWLDIPDGVSVSREGDWIAISNHNTHNVFLYQNTPSLQDRSDPDGILRGASYPHGLRFTSDGQFALVADAGEPYVYLYGRNGSDWRGVHNPLAALRVMDDETFSRGRSCPEEGGPKGMDVDHTMRILATTCECQPLAFFDLERILTSVAAQNSRDRSAETSADRPGTVAICEDERVWAVGHELGREARLIEANSKLAEANKRAGAADSRAMQAEARAQHAEADLRRAELAAGQSEARALRAEALNAALTASKSWRITAPLRRARSVLRKPSAPSSQG